MDYTIGEFAELTGLSVHTLRYYEREKLLSPRRSAANRRLYCEQDISWLAFVKRLKDTGMPIREIRHYAELRALGSASLCKRLEMLSQHRRDLEQQLQTLQMHMEKLDEKIEYYHAEIQKTQNPK